MKKIINIKRMVVLSFDIKKGYYKSINNKLRNILGCTNDLILDELIFIKIEDICLFEEIKYSHIIIKFGYQYSSAFPGKRFKSVFYISREFNKDYGITLERISKRKLK